jgi:hypothetical protein
MSGGRCHACLTADRLNLCSELLVLPNQLLPKLSDLILHAVVAAGFLPDFVIQAGSLRFSSLDRAKLSFVGLRKLRNLKVAATKSLNLGSIIFLKSKPLNLVIQILLCKKKRGIKVLTKSPFELSGCFKTDYSLMSPSFLFHPRRRSVYSPCFQKS